MIKILVHVDRLKFNRPMMLLKSEFLFRNYKKSNYAAHSSAVILSDFLSYSATDLVVFIKMQSLVQM